MRDDVASILTVDTIERERMRPELGHAAALRAATLAILDSVEVPSFAHPAAWGPFILVGEGR